MRRSRLLIFLTDWVYVGGDPVLNHAGPFEIVASLLGIVMTEILLIGILERRNGTILKMGYDSAILIAVSLGGVTITYRPN